MCLDKYPSRLITVYEYQSLATCQPQKQYVFDSLNKVIQISNGGKKRKIHANSCNNFLLSETIIRWDMDTTSMANTSIIC